VTFKEKGIGTREQGTAKDLPGLKPDIFCWLYAGVETPASLRIDTSLRG
jgi:hypothetical protein